MSSQYDPGEALVKLRQRLADECAKQGLTLRQFAFVPNEDGPHTVQAFFTVDGDIGGDPEQARMDAQFNEMMAQSAIESRDEDLRRRIEGGMDSIEGLLGPDDDEGDDGLAPA